MEILLVLIFPIFFLLLFYLSYAGFFKINCYNIFFILIYSQLIFLKSRDNYYTIFTDLFIYLIICCLCYIIYLNSLFFGKYLIHFVQLLRMRIYIKYE